MVICAKLIRHGNYFIKVFVDTMNDMVSHFGALGHFK